MAEQRDKIIGGFKVLQEIQVGAGSQGTVYKAVCEEDKHGLVPVGTLVALKVMAVQDEGGVQWRKLQKRTAELVRLDHPNVVKYYGCFSEQGLFNDVHVVVQEFLHGETLKERLARQSTGLDVDEGVKVVDLTLAGLEYTTGCGIVHRDLKPGNIFLCDGGGVKLIDFEIAKQEGGTATASVGNIRGSFDYMAPDFTNPEFHGDVQSDVFSMGVVLHEVLCGKTPYERLDGDDKQANFAFLSRWSQTLANGHSPIHVSSRIRRLLSHADAVICRAIAQRREERYPDFRSFREGLKTIRFRILKNGKSAYQLLQFIGKGGFGEVFKARDRQTGQLVAVKHLMKAAYAERFHREAKIMQKLHSPCFVQFVDFFMMEAGGGHEAFLIMAFLDGMPGSSLRDAIKHRADAPMPWRDVFVAFARYARGLLAMHSMGIFHRDIKPSNLYYPPGRPQGSAIMDFGIARDVNGTATQGQVPGTLDYMPPEVVVSESRGDGGMDIYALGLCLYEALTGKMAFPRLPNGATAYSTFFERAKARRDPNFDAPEVRNDGEILSLLKDMTNPDELHRLRNAGVLLKRLESIIETRFGGDDDGEGYGPETVAATVAMPGSNDADTIATSAMQAPEIAAIEKERRRVAKAGGFRKFQILSLAVLLVGLAVATVYRFRDPIMAKFSFGDKPVIYKSAQATVPRFDEPVKTRPVPPTVDEHPGVEEDPEEKARREEEQRKLDAQAAALKAQEEAIKRQQEQQQAEIEKQKKELETQKKKLEDERKAEDERRREEADKLEAERKRLAEAASRLAADKTKTDEERAAESKRINDEKAKLDAEEKERKSAEKARRDKEEMEQKEAQRRIDEKAAALKAQEESMKKRQEELEAQKKKLEDERKAEDERRKDEKKKQDEALAAATAKAIEEARKAAEEEARKEMAEKMAEMQRQIEEARIKAEKEKAEREAEAKRLEDERKKIEEARIRAEKEAARMAEEQKAAEEKAAKEKAEREAETKRLEEARKTAEEAQRKAEEEAARIAAERKAAEEARKKAEEEAARIAAERKAAEEARKKAEEEAARIAAERKAAEEKAARDKARREDLARSSASDAKRYYENEENYEAVRNYYEAVTNGYSMTADDISEFEDAYKRENDRLQKMKASFEKQMNDVGRNFNRDIKEIESKIKNLGDWHFAVTNKLSISRQ